MRGMRQGPIQSYISLATRYFIEEDVCACVRGVAFAIAPELVTLGEYSDRVVLRLTGRGVAFQPFFFAFKASRDVFLC